MTLEELNESIRFRGLKGLTVEELMKKYLPEFYYGYMAETKEYEKQLEDCEKEIEDYEKEIEDYKEEIEALEDHLDTVNNRYTQEGDDFDEFMVTMREALHDYEKLDIGKDMFIKEMLETIEELPMKRKHPYYKYLTLRK